MKITDWAVEDRPRERLWSKGPSSLSDAELLAILIGSGTRNHSALDLARELLAMAGNSLGDLGRLSAGEIRKIKGVGEAKAVTIAAALELGRRRKIAETGENPQIRSSADVYNIIVPCDGRPPPRGVLDTLPQQGKPRHRPDEDKPGRRQRHRDRCAHCHEKSH
ncbi:MAG: hypothetical protein MZV63_43875 [Marinilabiliales bacterium]|nr:hypothetical protein [Marinilabiliales bacterium]